MADEPIDFRLLAGTGVLFRQFKAGDVIFRQGDPAAEIVCHPGWRGRDPFGVNPAALEAVGVGKEQCILRLRQAG